MSKKEKILDGDYFCGGIELSNEATVRGWVHDYRRPAQPIVLDVSVDDIIVAKIVASLPRPDCDAPDRKGCMGFSVAINLMGAAGRMLCLRCSDQPDLMIGPVLIEGTRHDLWSADVLGRVAHAFAHITATHEENMRKSQHVFDHVTATHERLLGVIHSHRSSPRSLREESEFLGIGRRGLAENSDALERELFKARLETEISTIRQAS